ncbi:unnamed protein product [Cuscuta europaea]|uniref:Uncharacterized protein n=1 Tax=Cuscuta europaea TaxID=41803 RepID=A0A9P0ZGF0_CUSEU|nr:unnamed protein product [Cuscuta europaea]
MKVVLYVLNNRKFFFKFRYFFISTQSIHYSYYFTNTKNFQIQGKYLIDKTIIERAFDRYYKVYSTSSIALVALYNQNKFYFFRRIIFQEKQQLSLKPLCPKYHK